MDIVRAFADNEDTQEINIQGTYEEPLFQANQIGKLLGLVNIRESLKNFDNDEVHVSLTDTNAGIRECTYLTEVGLYRLLGMSQKIL